MENCGWASDLASTLEYPFRVFRFSLRSSAFWISVVPFFLLSTCWYSLFIKTDFIIFWINDFYVYIGLSLYSSCGTFSVQNRSRNLTPKSIWVLLFAFLSNLLPNILTSDFWYHLILGKTFLSLRFSDQKYLRNNFHLYIGLSLSFGFCMPFCFWKSDWFRPYHLWKRYYRIYL